VKPSKMITGPFYTYRLMEYQRCDNLQSVIIRECRPHVAADLLVTVRCYV